eukprot:Partr_v1_DN26336_c0_g1_i1_m43046 putative Cytochrome p450
MQNLFSAAMVVAFMVPLKHISARFPSHPQVHILNYGYLFYLVAREFSQNVNYLSMAVAVPILMTLAHKILAWSQMAKSVPKHLANERHPPFYCGFIPYFGVAPEYSLDPISFLKSMRVAHGNVFSVYFAGRIITIVLDPDFEDSFYRSSNEKMMFFEPLVNVQLDKVIGRAFTSDIGPLMTLVSKKLIPRYNEMIPKFEREIEFILRERIYSGVNLWDSMDRIVLGLSMEVLCSTFTRDEEVLTLIKQLEHCAQMLIMRPGLLGRSILKETDSIRGRFITKVSSEIQRRKTARICTADSIDFMDILIELEKDNDNAVEYQVIVDAMVGLLFGAVANTNAAAVYAIAHLCKDREILNQIELEISHVMTSHGQFSPKMLQDLVLMEALILEVTRIYAIVLSMRTTNADFQSAEFIIPRGQTIAYSSNLAMLDTFSGEFNPYRFLKRDNTNTWIIDETAKKQYIGFGRGVHLCKGMQLAKIEMKMMLCMLLNKYELV